MTHHPVAYQVVRKSNGVVVSTHETYDSAIYACCDTYRYGQSTVYNIVILTQPVAGASFLTEGSAS